MSDSDRTDLIDVLLDQHAQIRSLLDEVATAGLAQRQEPFAALVRLLAVHEAAEEQVLHPAARGRMPDGDSVVDARLAEEQESKELLAELERLGPEHDDFADHFARLRELVLAHAEHEERSEFPGVRAHYRDDERVALGTALLAAEKLAPTHPHPHDPERPPGNLLLGPVMGLADRARDLLRDTLAKLPGKD